MARLRTLGALELTDVRGQPVDAILARQRRAALLVYLALESRAGFVRRETLLPLFWPEMDQARARAALRQSLYVLRSEVGDDVVVTRGAEEVRVGDGLECDVVLFKEHADGGRLEEALALYQGAFLAGFYISDAPGFERWVEDTRESLRRSAAACGTQLAATLQQRGDLDGAIRNLRRSLELEPTDERAVRSLLSALEAAGDRAGALRAHEEYAAILRRDYEIEPSAETDAVVGAIRERGRAVDSRPPSAFRAVAALIAPQTLPVPGSDASPRGGWLRRSVAVAAMLAVAVFGTRALLGSRDIGDREPRLVVLPFAIRGGPQIAYLGEGMADMLSTSLDGPELFRSVPTTVVLGDVRARGSALDDVTKLRLTARRFGAQHLIVGSVVSAQGRLRLDARLYGESDEPRVLATVTGHPDSIFFLVDRLATQLIAGSLGSAPAKRLRATAALTTRSLAALRDYLQGERAIREGAFGTAQDFLRKAVAEDSTFALAYYRLSMAVEWLGDPVAAREVAALAERHASRLSMRDRALLSAHSRSLRGYDDVAEQNFRSILSESPDDPEAWLKLGEVLFHSNPLRGRSILEAREPFYRVLSYDPSHRVALLHLARLAAFSGNLAELDSLEARFVARGADEEALGIRAMAASVRRDRPAMASVVRQAQTASDDAVVDAARLTFTYTHNPADALAIMAANLGPSRSEERRALTHLQMAVIELARGRTRAASAQFAAALPVFPSVARDLEIFYALRAPVPLAADELRRMRSRLEAFSPDRPTRARRMLLPATIIDVEPQVRLALLSEISARLGDSTSAARFGAELEATPAAPGAGWSRSLVLDEWRAHRDLAAGRAAQVLSGLSLHPLRDPEASVLGFPWTAGVRAAKALALEKAGRLRDAVVQHSSFEHQSVFFAPLVGAGLFRSAELLERLGDRAGARANYERVVAIWADADPEYRQLVDSAKTLRGALR